MKSPNLGLHFLFTNNFHSCHFFTFTAFKTCPKERKNPPRCLLNKLIGYMHNHFLNMVATIFLPQLLTLLHFNFV